MKGRSSGVNSDSEQNTQKEDLSILRKPIHTALSGFLESKRAYENGTEEIRRLLARECDIIYECNTCRNLFRSLTNFISHKRVYCRNSINIFSNNFNPNQNGFIDQDISTIIQAEQDYVKKSTTNSSHPKDINNTNKDLSSIIERLVKREQNNRLMKITDFYDQVNNKLTQDEVLQKKHILQLDRVPNSQVAVYQTLKKSESDNIKAEVDEVNNMLTSAQTALGSDGKMISPISLDNTSTKSGSSPKCVTEEKLDQNTDISCAICKLKFGTEKTLKLHIQTKHISSTYVFQCPSCTLTFLQPGAVIRHLSNDHKKSNRKIRMMRESIYKRRVRIDEVQKKGPSRELARLQTDKEREDAENKAWLDNIERSNNSPLCTYCGKTFERKAVLNTHLNNCQMKSKLSNLVTEKNILVNGEPFIPPPPPIKQTNKWLDESKYSSSSNSPNSFDLDQKYDTTSDHKDSIDLRDTSKERHSIDNQNRRKRRKPPKILSRSDDMDSDTVNEMFANLSKNTNDLSLKTVCFDNLTKSENDEFIEGLCNIKQEPTSDTSPPPRAEGKPQKTNNTKLLPCFCKICKKRFDALSNLRRHISMFHYRSRKFGCKMCDYRAFRKYDVINHLGATHSLAGDKDMISDFIQVFEEKFFKDCVEEEIVLITDTENIPVEEKHEEKRHRRSKISKNIGNEQSTSSTSSKKTEILKEQKIKRSSSQLSLSSNDDSVQNRRPIRNRIKPVNKDFVYDLSNLLKKDMVFVERSENIKTLKRRNTTTALNDDINQDVDYSVLPNCESKKIFKSSSPRGFDITKDLVQGVAQKTAQLIVSEGRAALATLPEIPAARPLMRSSLSSVSRNSDNTFNYESSDLEDTQYKSVTSEDSFIESFSKRRRIDLNFKTKPSLPDSILNSLQLKFDEHLTGRSLIQNQKASNIPQSNGDIDLHHNMNTVNIDSQDETCVESLSADPSKVVESTQNVHLLPLLEPDPSIPNFSSPLPPSNKRITLFQRINENKAKRLKESLLRSALEN